MIGDGDGSLQIDGTGFSGLIKSSRLTPTLATVTSGLSTNVSLGQTTIGLDSGILTDLDDSTFSGLISEERIGGFPGTETTVSLSTSFTGPQVSLINIGIGWS